MHFKRLWINQNGILKKNVRITRRKSKKKQTKKRTDRK